MQYKVKKKELDLYVIPSIAQRSILGIDFWREFSLAPDTRNQEIGRSVPIIQISVKAT